MMKMRFALMGLLALSVSSPALAKNPSALRPSVSRAAVVATAKEKLTETFLDPTGAQLRNVTIWNIGNGNVMFTVCGDVNGKNAYGAYTGFKPFSISVKNYSGLSAYNGRIAGTSAGDNYIVDRTCASALLKPEWRM